MIRGGGWGGYALYCRSASRNLIDPSDRVDAFGFRLASVGVVEGEPEGIVEGQPEGTAEGEGLPEGVEEGEGAPEGEGLIEGEGEGQPEGVVEGQPEGEGTAEGEGEGQTETIVLPGGVPLEMVRIPAGSFQMGSPESERGGDSDEGPVHAVTIGYDFYLAKYEVTQAQWLALTGSWPGPAPSTDYGLGDRYPAYNVSWDDAQRFIAALNAHLTATGQGPAAMRLPSEAEWEYACRAGTQTRFYFGDSLTVADQCEYDGIRSQYMWYCGNNTPQGSRPVGGLLPNAFGLYDMSGNLWEWCEDDWNYGYSGAPADGSVWANELRTSRRVVRGGGWDYGAGICRSAFRGLDDPSTRNFNIGFRLASVR